MAFEVYFKEDILNALRSVYAANEGATGLTLELLQDPELQGVALTRLVQIYRRGFITALGAIGLAFGLDALPLSCSAHCALLSEPQQSNLSASGQQAEWSEAQTIGFLWHAMNHDSHR